MAASIVSIQALSVYVIGGLGWSSIIQPGPEENSWSRDLLVEPFWGLQGINFVFSSFIADLHTDNHIADPGFPFDRRIRETHAVLSGRDFSDSLTAITLINNRLTAASIKLASSFAHEDALRPFPYSCTNHDNQILSLKILK